MSKLNTALTILGIAAFIGTVVLGSFGAVLYMVFVEG